MSSERRAAAAAKTRHSPRPVPPGNLRRRLPRQGDSHRQEDCDQKGTALVASAETAREELTFALAAAAQIKVGQFKDGLDMSAIREVKFLRELKHPNVIEVRVRLASRRPWANAS